MHTQIAYRGKIKYDEATAKAYQERPPRQHAAEIALIDRVLRAMPTCRTMLDLPCGAGRVSLHLAQRGYAVTCADNSASMLELTRRVLEQNGLDCAVDPQDIEALTYNDRQFDAILCFRLFHHFPTPEIRQRAVAELTRVARRYVALSYFSPWSATSVKRRLRAALGGRPSQKCATPCSEVCAYFTPHGFRLVADFARSPLLHTLHVALFERVQ